MKIHQIIALVVILFACGCGVKSDVIPPTSSWVIFESNPLAPQNIKKKKTDLNDKDVKKKVKNEN